MPPPPPPQSPPPSLDRFIHWLGEDAHYAYAHTPSHTLPRPLRYAGMVAVSGIVAGILGVVGLWLFGGDASIREGYVARLAESAVMAKQAIPLLIAGFAVPIVLRLSLPEGRAGGVIVLLILACSVLPVMAGVQLWLTPMGEWQALLSAPSLVQCLLFVPILSLMLTGVQIMSLRQWAVTKPLLTGAMVGVLSGATATIIYALFCIEDAPAFYGFWYSVGILASASIGVLAGGRWLRW